MIWNGSLLQSPLRTRTVYRHAHLIGHNLDEHWVLAVHRGG